jgi:hypothetical protein
MGPQGPEGPSGPTGAAAAGLVYVDVNDSVVGPLFGQTFVAVSVNGQNLAIQVMADTGLLADATPLSFLYESADCSGTPYTGTSFTGQMRWGQREGDTLWYGSGPDTQVTLGSFGRPGNCELTGGEATLVAATSVSLSSLNLGQGPYRLVVKK